MYNKLYPKKLFIIPIIFYNISINQSINQPIKYNHDNFISFNSFNITLEYVNNLNILFIYIIYIKLFYEIKEIGIQTNKSNFLPQLAPITTIFISSSIRVRSCCEPS